MVQNQQKDAKQKQEKKGKQNWTAAHNKVPRIFIT